MANRRGSLSEWLRAIRLPGYSLQAAWFFKPAGGRPSIGESDDQAEHMRNIEKTVTDIARDEDPHNRFSSRFYDGTPMDIHI